MVADARRADGWRAVGGRVGGRDGRRRLCCRRHGYRDVRCGRVDGVLHADHRRHRRRGARHGDGDGDVRVGVRLGYGVVRGGGRARRRRHAADGLAGAIEPDGDRGRRGAVRGGGGDGVRRHLHEPGDLDRVFSVQNLPVLVSSTDGTAMSDDGDYEKKDTTTTVAFADFSASGTGSARGLSGRFATDSFEAYADAVEDADETFNVGIRFSGAVDGRIALDADNSSSVATIVEGPSVTLTLSDDDLDEGDTATVTAAVDPVHDMPFTVTLSTDSDRIAFPDGTTFNFAASAATASETPTVEAVDNEVDDGDAEVEIEATVSDAAVTEPPALELTVRDDDDPTVSIAAPTGAMDDFLYEAEAAVDAPEYQWSLTRVGLTDEELIVDVSVAETGGGDFVADGMESVTFEAGESTAAYTPITADDLDEEHGTVTVTVDSGTGYAVDPDAASAALDVRDDDGDLVTVTLDPATLTVKEGRKAQLYAEAETEAGTFDTAAHLTRLFGATVTQASAEASTEDGTATAGRTTRGWRRRRWSCRSRTSPASPAAAACCGRAWRCRRSRRRRIRSRTPTRRSR